MNAHDPLDKAFDALKARSRERARCNPDLEERMMKEFVNANRRRRSVFAKAAVVAVLLVAVAGAAVAATGGIGRLFHWTGTVESQDGKVYHVEDGNVLDAEGKVIGTAEVELATE